MRDILDLSLVSAPLVLIADDDENMRELLGRSIRIRLPGARIRTAIDGADAVRQALELVPDVILMDIGMPVLSGVEAACRLRTHERTRDIPIVAVTGLPWSAALGEWFVDHVHKPWRIEDLVAVVRSVLPVRARAAAPVPTAAPPL